MTRQGRISRMATQVMLLCTLLALADEGLAQTTQAKPVSSEVPTRNQISTTIPLYTDFDLFKNTGFTPCVINSNTSADPTTTNFIVSREVSTQEEFCSFMAGTPIMIPTTPHKVAFFPWYPTQVIQALSLLVSYVGLLFILRRVDHARNTGVEYKTPLWQWCLLLLDLARNVAFAFEVAHGFSDPTQFTWASVLFWMLPLNYVFVMTQMRAVKQSARLFAAAAATWEEPYAGAAMQIKAHFQLRASQLLGRNAASRRENDRPMSDIDAITALPGISEQKRQASLRYTASSNGLPSLASIAGDYATTNKRRTAPRGTTVWTWIVTAVASWFITLIVTVLHWKWAFPHPAVNQSSNQTSSSSASSLVTAALASSLYAQIDTAISNPQSVGNMPVSCLNYLSSGSLLLDQGGAFFAEPTNDLSAFSILTTLQFIFTTITMIVAVYVLFIRRGTRPSYPQFVSTSPYAAAAFAHDEQLAQAASSQRTKTLLLLSGGITAFFLLVPAFALGMDIVARVDRGSARVDLRFTNDLHTTGGCTFAFVDMDKRAGYWDVPLYLGERVVTALLGVA
jgi:hypothetical protein